MNFSGVNLVGLELIDAAGGADSVIGSSGDDRIAGGTGNDWIDGAGGKDTAVFAGTMATYSVVKNGATIVVKDLATGTNGNDGTDTLLNVEVLQFLDGVVDSTAPPPNSAPTAVSDVATAYEDGGSVGIDVLVNDADPDANDTKIVTSVNSAGLVGALQIVNGGAGLVYNTNGAFQALKEGEIATETFSYTMADGSGATSTAAVTVTVVGTNDGPTAVSDNATVAVDGNAVVINVLANDTDPDAGDSKTVIAVNSAGLTGIAQVTGGGTGVLYYANGAFEELGQGASATEIFTYTMVDGTGAQSTATVTLTVAGVNDAPMAFADSLALSANSGPTTIDVLANDTDIDVGDSKMVLSVDGNGTPGWIELILIYGVGVGIWHPGTPPILGTVSVAADGQSVVYSSNGAFVGLGAGQTATETFTYLMSDGAGAQGAASATITILGVNDGPTANDDGVEITTNSGPVSVDVLANDTDPDANDTKTILSINAVGALGGVAIAADGQSVIYTVGNAFAGLAEGAVATDSFTYTMVDSQGVQSSAQVTMTISGTNHAPLGVADVANAVENGAPITIDVLANDTDVDVGDGKTVIAVNGAGLLGSVSVAPGGTGVIYAIGSAFQSLKAGATTTETFTYTVADTGGAQSVASVVVTITGINDAPGAVVDAATIDENAGPLALAVLANDTDIDVGDTKSILSINATGLKGTAAIAPDQQGIVYTPYQSLRVGQTALDTFTYTMVDGGGVQSTATVTMTVIGANDAPTAVANAVSLSEDAGATKIAVLANDTDLDAGDTKRVISVDTTGLQGVVTIAANGTGVVYAPGSAFQYLLTGQSAVESFSYTMADAAGATSSAVVSVTIVGATDGPKAINDTATAMEDGGPIVINVLANDLNDQSPGGALTITSLDGTGEFGGITLILIYGVGVGQVHPGFPRLLGEAVIAPDGHSIIYTPLQSLNAGETGVDQFKYTITGTGGGTSTGIVSVTVTGANDAPVANNDTAIIAADDAPLFIDVLANDTDLDTRIDPPPPPADELGPWDATPVDVPDTKTVIAVNGVGLQGSVAIAANGTGVVYTVGGALLGLAYGVTGTESFTYTMVDGAGAQSTATVTVTVTGVNHAPTALADTANAIENGPTITIDVLANDSDSDIAGGDSLALASLNTSGLQGSAAINGNVVNYSVGNAFQSLRAGATAVDIFSYSVVDSSGATSTATVTVTVTGINDGPVAVANSLSVSEDAGAVAIDVLANDTDLDVGDTKSIVSINTAGLQGSVTVAADGSSLVYTVGAGFQALLSGQSALETFSYTMADGSGAQSTAIVSITIIGANEPVVYVNPPAPPPGAILGTAADDVMTGTTGNDVMYSLAGDDEIRGGGGNDSLFGGADDDDLLGEAGNDILVGGAGKDDMTGGTGADIFRFYLTTDAAVARLDTIRDFSSAQGDKIDLSFIDANHVLGGNNDFFLASSFTGSAGALVMTATSSGMLLQGDVNGDAVADFAIDLRLNAGVTLTDADFIF